MPEMQDRTEETLEWIRYADRDLRAAELLLQGEKPLLENGLFSCQQAVEKWLKAWLIWQGIAFPKIHDLKKIGKLCVQAEPDLSELAESVSELTDFATVYRYPGAELALDAAEAIAWLDLTRRARAELLSRMPPAVRDAVASQSESRPLRGRT
jgi:HEPN domain-containing protein